MGERSDAASLYGEIFSRGIPYEKNFLEGGMREGGVISPSRDPRRSCPSRELAETLQLNSKVTDGKEIS